MPRNQADNAFQHKVWFWIKIYAGGSALAGVVLAGAFCYSILSEGILSADQWEFCVPLERGQVGDVEIKPGHYCEYDYHQIAFVSVTIVLSLFLATQVPSVILIAFLYFRNRISRDNL